MEKLDLFFSFFPSSLPLPAPDEVLPIGAAKCPSTS